MVGAFIPAPLCSRNYVRTSLRTPTLHYAFIHASTSAPHSISSSILSLHMFRFFSPYLCHFPLHFQRLPSFLRRVSPNSKNPFGFDKEWSLFPKGFKKQISKRQIQQGILSIIFTDKKNKKSSKDKAANTNQRFGQ